MGDSASTDPDTGDIYRGLDRFGRIKDCRWIFNVGATPPDRARIQYGYNRAGSRVWRKDVVAAAAAAGYDELYYYDGLQRLSDMQRGTLNSGHTALTSETFAQCWTLDATGNWGAMRQAATGGAWTLEQTRTANTVNEITAIGAVAGPVWATPEYDPAGNMTTIPQPEDPARHYTATYDAWNRLVRLTEPEESSSSSSSSVSGGSSSSSSEPAERTVAEYKYDARRYRIWQKEYSPATQITQVYYTEAWQAIEERNAPQTFPTANVQYIWGIRYIDDLVRRDRMGIGPIDDQLYVLQDANWNVIAITNASVTAAVQERYAYSAYGEPLFLEPDYTPQSSSQFAWTSLYTGLLRSPWTGLIAARNRLYQPGMGVWLSRDPVTYIDSSNLYLYVKARPVSLADPSGLADVFDMWDLRGPDPEGSATCSHVQECREDEERLKRLHCKMKWLVAAADQWQKTPSAKALRERYPKLNLNSTFSSTYTLNAEMYTGIRRAYVYSWTHYQTTGPGAVHVGPAFLSELQAPGAYQGQNWPMTPGFTITRDRFFGPDKDAIGTLAHEPQHDFGSPGTWGGTGIGGHDASGQHTGGMPHGSIESANNDLFYWAEGLKQKGPYAKSLMDRIDILCRQGIAPE